MAKTLEVERPYINLKEYHEYKSRGLDILERNKEKILREE